MAARGGRKRARVVPAARRLHRDTPNRAAPCPQLVVIFFSVTGFAFNMLLLGSAAIGQASRTLPSPTLDLNQRT